MAWRVGIEPPSDDEEFGGVNGGVLLANGSVVVNDLRRARLVAISPDGRAVRPYGRKGEGPKEFGEVSILIRDSGQTFTLLDNGLFRRNEYVLDEAGISERSSRRTAVQPYEACRGREGLIVLDYDPVTQRPLHKLTADGERTAGFGLPLRPGSNHLNESLAQGSILCLPGRDAIAYAASTGDLLLLDAAAGRVIWRRHIPDYLPVQIEEVGALVRFTYAPPPENRAHYPTGIFQLGERHLLIALAVQRREVDEDGKVRIYSADGEVRIVELSTGAEVGRLTGTPIVLDIRDGLALVRGDEPEPWVGVVPFEVEMVEK